MKVGVMGPIFPRSLTDTSPAELTSVNARVSKPTGAGAAVLCEDRPALWELFDVEEEVLFSTSFEDLMKQTWRPDDDPDLGRPIEDPASTRAHSEHRYAVRLAQILADCT